MAVLSILAERAQFVKSREGPSAVGIKTALFRFRAARGSRGLPPSAREGPRDTTWETPCGTASSSWSDLACQSEGLRPLPQRPLHPLALHPRPRVRVRGRHAQTAVGGRLVAQDQLPDERIDAGAGGYRQALE